MCYQADTMLPTINKKIYKKIKSKAQKKAIKALAYGRITPYAVAQFLHHSMFAINTKKAIIFSFHVPPKYFTKKERKHLKFIHTIAQEQYLQKVHKLALYDPRSAASVRAIAEMRGMLNQDSTLAQSQRPKLTINLTDKKERKLKKDTQNNEDSTQDKKLPTRQKLQLIPQTATTSTTTTTTAYQEQENYGS